MVPKHSGFNEKRFDDVVQRGARAGQPVTVLYHAHLDVGVCVSATDFVKASFEVVD